ncbi:methyltransferase [Paenibacillus agaridevorans]|uniref:Small RNA 2'-O-methyltransferase n=1 Tax=Paenibacillus agaridevorans TaxID=171404 RepID=A0A2R5EUA7_9BACL|nr:class I SAM-dependent methyltransferase [Paenibacillus agaridevorans]GBG09259.1 methyltransferase [Paenibacillus agaridevorans]
MAIVQLSSSNPMFSFLIRKNPGAGMLLRSVRQGMAYGWYTNEDSFNVYFKDADNGVSYKQHENDRFEYLNVSRYNTPLFPLNAINEFFAAPFKKHDERDTEGYEHSFVINMIHIDRLHYIAFFEKHMKDYAFELEHLAGKSYRLTVRTSLSLYHLLHAVSVLCLFLSMFGNEYIDISAEILDKYIRSLHVIDAPFYIRSLFARNFLTTRELFKKHAAEIERSGLYEIRLAYGNTAQQRRSFVSGKLAFDDTPLLDIGCGEGYYAMSFAGKIETTYYAIDIEEELLATVARKAEKKGIDNIALFRSLDHFLESYNGETVDVILTEVVEHMEEAMAADFVKQICDSVAFRQLILTTPNSAFNGYYELEELRHDDHKWEKDEAEFRAWLEASIGETEYDIEYISIGDSVNGVHTTQGAIIKRKELQR